MFDAQNRTVEAPYTHILGLTQAADPTFYDEFDDLRNWIIHVVPDSPNDEYQFYTDRTKNVRVEHGYLKESEITQR